MTVLDSTTNNDIVIALIDRHTKISRFVVAWDYDDDRGEWSQGHYFETITTAVDYFNANYRQTPDNEQE